jgi:AbrB family looped-hinge helix DNA binding protein
MLATVTDKGQVTVPKEIRDRLGIAAGSKLDFRLEADGTLRVRKLDRGSAGLFGLLHDADQKAAPAAEMDAAVAQSLAADDLRIRGAAKSKARRG